MAMLKLEGYDEVRSKKALEMLLNDRKNEFRTLQQTILWHVPTSTGPIENWEEFILNFCMDVCTAFKTWNGTDELPINASLKALTILRQLAREKNTMNELTHLLNIAFNLAEEFKVIYKRIE